MGKWWSQERTGRARETRERRASACRRGPWKSLCQLWFCYVREQYLAFYNTQYAFFNPFAPKPPVTARADPRPFYQLCPLTFGGWRAFIPYQNEHNRRKRQKKKKHITLTWQFPWKSCFTTRLSFLSSNSKILKAFLNIYPPKCTTLQHALFVRGQSFSFKIFDRSRSTGQVVRIGGWKRFS